MTPISNPENESEEAYNQCHKKARSFVERGIGVLKSRFRCLSKQRVLMYSPAKSGAIISACAALHNLLILNDFPLPREENIIRFMDENVDNEVHPEDLDHISVLTKGKEIRQSIVRDYF